MRFKAPDLREETNSLQVAVRVAGSNGDRTAKNSLHLKVLQGGGVRVPEGADREVRDGVPLGAWHSDGHTAGDRSMPNSDAA